MKKSKKVSFKDTDLICETWSKYEYDRKSNRASCNTQREWVQVKLEMLKYKNLEMVIHLHTLL
jgi:hypothetical protein